MNLYTTSLPVSQRIKELVGEQESYFYWNFDGQWYVTNDNLQYKTINAFLLSELPKVLKKVGEKLGWREIVYEWESDTEIRYEWMHRYLKCCELHALGQDVDDYLMSILE